MPGLDTTEYKQRMCPHYYLTEHEAVEDHVYETIEEVSEDKKEDNVNVNTGEDKVMNNEDDTCSEGRKCYNVITDKCYNVLPERAGSVFSEEVCFPTPDNYYYTVIPEKCQSDESDNCCNLAEEMSVSGSRILSINFDQGLKELQIDKPPLCDQFHSLRRPKPCLMYLQRL